MGIEKEFSSGEEDQWSVVIDMGEAVVQVVVEVRAEIRAVAIVIKPVEAVVGVVSILMVERPDIVGCVVVVCVIVIWDDRF